MSSPVNKNRAVWLGPLLGLIGVASYFALILPAGWRSLADLPWPSILLVLAGVVVALIGTATVWQTQAVSNTKRAISGLGLAFAGFSAWVLIGYLFVMSANMPDSAGVMPEGDPFPAAVSSLQDNSGTAVSLDDLTSGDAILVFFRGHW